MSKSRRTNRANKSEKLKSAQQTKSDPHFGKHSVENVKAEKSQPLKKRALSNLSFKWFKLKYAFKGLLGRVAASLNKESNLYYTLVQRSPKMDSIVADLQDMTESGEEIKSFKLNETPSDQLYRIKNNTVKL